MSERVQVGDTLFGFCGGYFGRDSYEDKRVEAVGKDWIVCRDDRGEVHFARGIDPDLFAADRQRKDDDD